MTLTVRLEPDLEEQLESYCQHEGTTKSAVVTQALREFMNARRLRRTPYEVYLEVAREMGLDSKDAALSTENSTCYKQRLRQIPCHRHEQ